VQYATKLNGLAGTYKLGGWYDSGSFPDQRFATTHRGHVSIYGVADQTIWQSTADGARSLNVFGRIMGAPSNQNFISFSFNGGVTLAAPIPGRNNDNAGIDLGIGKVSSRAADADADAGLQRQGTEELIELTYQASIAPWLVVQPDFQYIVNPGGGVQNPNDPKQNLRNELVIGARAIVTF